MDMGEKEERFGAERRSEDHLSYANMSDWRLGEPQMGLTGSSSAAAASMVDTLGSRHWCHSTNSQSLAFCDGSVSQSGSPTNLAAAPARLDMAWNAAAAQDGIPVTAMFLHNGGGVIPPSLQPQLIPTGSAFIQRAARLSCFNGVGFGGAVNLYGAGTYCSTAQKSDGRAGEAPRNGPVSADAAAGNDCGLREISGGREESPNSGNAAGCEPPSKGVAAKKRKRGIPDLEPDQTEGETQLSVETSQENVAGKQKVAPKASTSPSVKAGGKNAAKDGTSDAAKEADYIHVRARRGQATNSHSLAERLRREKISERMKFLQDLVPGCSKVTGKAVMLDEIINYVQSLQRQVEFLSMKLAAVNPRLDFTIEGPLSKEPQILQSRAGMSSSGFGLPPEMGHHRIDAHRRPLNLQLDAMNTYKEPANQISGTAWDDELHSVVQMGFGGHAALGIQDLHGSASPSRTKVEP